MEKAVVAAKTPSSTGRKSKSTTGEETPGSVRKTKSFKRIRGFLSGESRKERRERKARKRAASAAATPASTASRDGRGGALPAESEDDESFYDVDLEDRSIASSVATPVRKKKAQSSLLPQEKTEEEAMEDHEAFFSSSEFKKPYLLKVVLLLMDPKTRRFELLQLEFDSLKALVSDVLAQVPVSVTEDALRKQTYTGICGHAGKEMTREKLLATFCHGNDVLVAVPTGTSSKEVARLAKPILGDDKVGAMLLSSGIDAKAWKDEKPKKKKKTTIDTPKTSARSAPPKAHVLTEEKGSSTVLIVVSVVILAILLQVFHLYSSAPIRPGHVVSPGIWLSKCGILAFWPGCENQYLQMNNEGLMTLYNSKQEVAWQMEGRACPEGAEDCIPGMHVNLDGLIAIGGKSVSWVNMYEDCELSPWPFAEPPNIKIWKK